MRRLAPLPLLLAALAAATAPAAARPVNAAQASMVMAEAGLSARAGEATYSPTARIALGVRAHQDRILRHDFTGAAINLLALRRNAEGSQANLYLMGAAGVAKGRYAVPAPGGAPLSVHAAHLAAASGAAALTRTRPFQEPAYAVGAQADWESRRLLVQGQAHTMRIQGQGAVTTWRARAGVAPYIGEFGDLHTWLILQADRHPFTAREVTVSPVLRLFAGPLLLEAGASLQGEPFAALQFTF